MKGTRVFTFVFENADWPKKPRSPVDLEGAVFTLLVCRPVRVPKLKPGKGYEVWYSDLLEETDAAWVREFKEHLRSAGFTETGSINRYLAPDTMKSIPL